MQTFTGYEYLMIDVASNFGLDKENWDARLNWTESRQQHLENLAGEAKDPMLYLAGVHALRKAQKGEPTGYPVSFDATSSGLQLLACLTECRQSASLCNVVNTGDREDAYTLIYDEIQRRSDEVLEVTQPQAKQAVMTALYSSTAEPKKVFGEGQALATFYQVLNDLAPGAWALNLALQELWQPYALEHAWVMPDNFHVHCKVTAPKESQVTCFGQPVIVRQIVNQGTREGRSLGPNVIHAIDGMLVREITRRCSFDPKQVGYTRDELMLAARGVPYKRGCDRTMDKMVETLWQHYLDSGFLSARILDYLDDRNLGLVDPHRILELIDSMPKKPFPIMSIHDCFRVHPNYANDLRRQYNLLLAEVCRSSLLSYISSQISGQPVTVIKRNSISNDVTQADYSLC